MNKKELAKQYGINYNTFKDRLKRGWALEEALTKPLVNTNLQEIKSVEEKLLKFGFEYLSGYDNCKSKIKVKSLKCGHILECTYDYLSRFKGKEFKCPICRKEKELKSKEELNIINNLLKEQSKRLNKQLQFKLKLSWLKQNTIMFKTCSYCGERYADGGYNYCSKECYKNALRRRNRKRLKGKIVDKGITIKKLYQRDKGICSICGGICDFSNYHIVIGSDGREAKVVDKYYPTIDHIKPLAKGGLDEWDNVALAHFYCNTIKADSY